MIASFQCYLDPLSPLKKNNKKKKKKRKKKTLSELDPLLHILLDPRIHCLNMYMNVQAKVTIWNRTVYPSEHSLLAHIQ